MLEAIEQRATAQGVAVDARIERGRSYRHALERLLEHETFDRVVVPASAGPHRLRARTSSGCWEGAGRGVDPAPGARGHAVRDGEERRPGRLSRRPPPAAWERRLYAGAAGNLRDDRAVSRTRRPRRYISDGKQPGRSQRMSATHTTIDSPFGELTLVAEGRSAERPLLPGPLVHARRRTSSAPAPRAASSRPKRQLAEYFAGERTDFDLETAAGGDEFQRRVWELIDRIPYGRDHHLRGDRAGARRRADPGAQGRRRGRPQPALGDRPLPPRRRQGRQAHRLRRRPRAQAVPARAGGPRRGR